MQVPHVMSGWNATQSSRKTQTQDTTRAATHIASGRDRSATRSAKGQAHPCRREIAPFLPGLIKTFLSALRTGHAAGPFRPSGALAFASKSLPFSRRLPWSTLEPSRSVLPQPRHRPYGARRRRPCGRERRRCAGLQHSLGCFGALCPPHSGKRFAIVSGVSYLTICRRWSIEYTMAPCFTSIVAGPTSRIEAHVSDPSFSIANERKALVNTKHPTEETQRSHRGGPSLRMRLAERFIFA